MTVSSLVRRQKRGAEWRMEGKKAGLKSGEKRTEKKKEGKTWVLPLRYLVLKGQRDLKTPK